MPKHKVRVTITIECDNDPFAYLVEGSLRGQDGQHWPFAFADELDVDVQIERVHEDADETSASHHQSERTT